jgi:hypothetical protein
MEINGGETDPRAEYALFEPQQTFQKKMMDGMERMEPTQDC